MEKTAKKYLTEEQTLRPEPRPLKCGSITDRRWLSLLIECRGGQAGQGCGRLWTSKIWCNDGQRAAKPSWVNLLPEIKMLEKEAVKLPTQAGIKTTSLTQTNNPRLFDANCLKCCSPDRLPSLMILFIWTAASYMAGVSWMWIRVSLMATSRSKHSSLTFHLSPLHCCCCSRLEGFSRVFKGKVASGRPICYSLRLSRSWAAQSASPRSDFHLYCECSPLIKEYLIFISTFLLFLASFPPLFSLSPWEANTSEARTSEKLEKTH